MPSETGPADRPEVDIDKGQGETPAVNRPGPQAADDREVVPGNLGWDVPSDEAPETLDRSVRRSGADDEAEVRPPSDAAGRFRD